MMSADPPVHSHPSPHRDRMPVAALLAALATGPIAWTGQLIADYAIATTTCFPHDSPRLSGPPPRDAGVLLAVNLVCLVAVFAALIVAWIGWRRTHREDTGEMHHAVDIGEGRSRFLALCGMFGSAGFIVAIGFDTVAVIGTPTCWMPATWLIVS